MTTQNKNDSTCCPKFDPLPWDDKTFEWTDKKFIRESVFTFFYIPMNFSHVMKKLNEQVTKAGAEIPDWLCLSDHTSRWNMDLYLAVDRVIAGAENLTLTGTFYCKVYEGPFKDTEKWIKEFEAIVKSKGYKQKKLFMWYTTCPKCAKKYGSNHVVLLSQVE